MKKFWNFTVGRITGRSKDDKKNEETQTKHNEKTGGENLKINKQEEVEEENWEDAVDDGTQTFAKQIPKTEIGKDTELSADGSEYGKQNDISHCMSSTTFQTNISRSVIGDKGEINIYDGGANDSSDSSSSSDDSDHQHILQTKFSYCNFGDGNTIKHTGNTHPGYETEAFETTTVNDDTERNLNDLLKGVPFWTEDSELYSNCADYLKQLSEIVERTMIKKGSYDFWVKTLQRNQDLGKFFLRIKELESENKEVNFDTIRLFLNRLIRPAGDKRFINKTILKPWLDVTSVNLDMRSELTCEEIESVEGLLNVLKNRFLPYLRNNESLGNLENECDKEKFDTFISDQIALSVKVLYDRLQKNLDKENLVLLNIMLHSLSYNKSSGVFEILVTKSKLESFVSEGETKVHDFLNCRAIQRQGFLIQEAVIGCKSYRDFHIRDKVFFNLLEPIKDLLDQKVARVFSTYTTRSPFQLELLSNDLNSLQDNNNQLSQQLNLSRLKQSLNTQIDDKCQRDRTNIPQSLQGIQNDFIGALGLDNYFPSKILLQDVMKVQRQQSSLKIEDIPWIILKKIIMLDYRGRDDVLNEFYNSDSTPEPPTFSGDLESFIDVNYDSSTHHLNPLDVFLAIFSCCDSILKQVLITKMFLCRLAVPVIVKPLLNEELCLSLWPLRTLQVEGSALHLASGSTQVASFLRFKRPFHSKSALLNIILSEQHHNIFYHQDCPLGGTAKSLANGIVECSWYIPSTNQNEVIKGMITCLNLRGDALENEKQLFFLRDISNIIYLLVDIKDILTDELLQLYLSSAMIVLLLTSDLKGTEVSNILKSFRENIGEKSKRTKIIFLSKEGQKQNMETVKKEIKNYLKMCVDQGDCKRLTECSSIAKNYDITVDENDKKCSTGKRMANEIISCIEPGASIESFKAQHLPLQDNLWTNLSHRIKEQSKIEERNNPIVNEKLIQEMKKLRNEQVFACQNLSPVIYRFIETLVKYQDVPEILIYFLSWFSILLNERFCNEFSTLLQQYKSILSQTTNPRYQQSIAGFEQTMHAGLGLEHIIREIGQIYEALFETKDNFAQETTEKIQVLPFVVAKLLLSGQAIEIMDGDNSNIAMSWIKAVFSHLKHLTNDAKILVVTVVGVQSSGKSTLVNTMFGSQFNVSAGRCSKGVFMQMVPVEHMENHFGYEYIIVLDSEGLRSQETSKSTYDKDNKLATFVIGMSDITIVNIKGENYAEFKDVLQIVVHAFLRLKLANKNLKLRQSCVFAHQNVSAPDADDKTFLGRKMFVNSLDEMTTIAAEQENFPEISKFSEVIEFDSRKHCWYLKDLWIGNPPMSTVNHAYSEMVNAIRLNVTCVLPTQKSQLRLSDIEVHTEDLWNGILSDKFIFSFRNSIEIKAYNILEIKYNSLRWELEGSVFQLVQKKATEKLRWFKTIEENQVNINEIIFELQQTVIELSNDTKMKLEEFIRESEFREILLTWKQAKLLSINTMVESLIGKSKKQLYETQDQLRLDATLSKLQKELQSQVKDAAKSFFECLIDANPTMKQIEEGFEERWTVLLQKRAARELSSTAPVEKAMYSKLELQFSTRIQLLKKELKRCVPFKKIPSDRLEGSISTDDIEKEDIRIKEHFTGLRMKKLKSRDQCCLEIVDLTDRILRKIDKYMDNISHMDTKFDESFFNTLLLFVHEEIQQHNDQLSEQHHFSIREPFIIKLSVHVCKFAMPKFQAMNERYENKHSTISWFETQKGNSMILFKNIINQKTEENYAASILCSYIEDALYRTLKERLPLQIENKVLTTFSGSKTVLMKEMQMHLLERGNVNLFERYIDDPYTYALNWLTSFTKSFLTEERENKYSQFSEMSMSLISEIMYEVENSVLSATEEVKYQGFGMKGHIWIQKFKDGVKDHLHLSEINIKQVAERNIVDFTGFQTMLLKQIGDVKTKVTRVIQQTYDSCVMHGDTTVYQIVTDKLWGCTAVCPLCHEPCRHTDKDHLEQDIRHSCIQHRPLALRGVNDYDAKQKCYLLVTEPCNALVGFPGKRFSCSWCNNECRKSKNEPHTEKTDHLFTEFRSIFPDWQIETSRKNAPFEYWCCLMADYAFILKRKYGFDSNKIPSSWRNVDKKRAKKSLLKSLQL